MWHYECLKKIVMVNYLEVSSWFILYNKLLSETATIVLETMALIYLTPSSAPFIGMKILIQDQPNFVQTPWLIIKHPYVGLQLWSQQKCLNQHFVKNFWRSAITPLLCSSWEIIFTISSIVPDIIIFTSDPHRLTRVQKLFIKN